MLTTNYLIINRKPQPFESMEMDVETMMFMDESGNIIDVLVLDDSVFAALYCDEVRNTTLVVYSDEIRVITILWASDAEYEAGRRMIADVVSVPLSSQNKKINRYGEELAKKLADGVKLQVIDAVDNSAMVKCPDCGMLSPKGTPYCMDCGAELP
ncbi:MAG: zinc ribbon domain-containing protein [Clostridiales bacterium]|nr:zinc ribbon domain-containing protein [Candidatus Crickella equi]